jgi:hypothetical protein
LIIYIDVHGFSGIKMAENLINELYEEVAKVNARIGSKAIPHSDDFIIPMAATMGIGADLVKLILKILINAHKMFSIEIVHQDYVKNIPKVEGYVVTDINVIRKLKKYFQDELVIMYASQFHKNFMIHQVIKDIFPLMKNLNNTPIGQMANKAIMLEELEKLMEKSFNGRRLISRRK